MRQPWPNRTPCPCGSRRTFGACCRARYASDVNAWRRVQQTEDDLIPRIVGHAHRTWGGGLLDEAVYQFYISRTSRDSNRSAWPAFERWYVFTWVPGCPVGLYDVQYRLPEGWPGASLGVTWLTSTSSTVSHLEQAFVLTAARSPHSLLLVESVIPGWSLVVRDLLTGRQFRVVDPTISLDVPPDHILFSAILTLDGVSTLLGCASHAVEADVREMAWAAREVHTDGAWFTRTQLLHLTTNLSCDYRSAYDGDTSEDIETFGETPERLLLRWRVSAPFGEVFDRLRSLSNWHGGEEAIEDETGPDGVPHVSISWREPPPPPEAEHWRALAHLFLGDGRVSAHVATREIADRLIQQVSMRLGSAATLVETRPSLPIPVQARLGHLLPFVLSG